MNNYNQQIEQPINTQVGRSGAWIQGGRSAAQFHRGGPGTCICGGRPGTWVHVLGPGIHGG